MSIIDSTILVRVGRDKFAIELALNLPTGTELGKNRISNKKCFSALLGAPLMFMLMVLTPVDMDLTQDMDLTPVDMELTPVDMDLTPVDMDLTPVDMELTPVDMELTPVDMVHIIELTLVDMDLAVIPLHFHRSGQFRRVV